MSRSKSNQSSGGCVSAIYWITIGWVIWLFKWFFIILYKILKFLVAQSQIGIEKLSTWAQARLAESGRSFSMKKVRAAVTLAAAVFVVGICGILGALSDSETGRVSFTPTFTWTPTHTITLTPSRTPTKTRIPPTSTPLYGSAYETRCIPRENEIQTAEVVRVIDGDTIVVTIDGEEFHLRYIGIDTSESGEKFGDTAKKMNEDLVLGKTVFLVKDVSEVDSFGRLLRYVFVDDVFVNYELVLNGAARAGTWKPDIACDSVLKTAQKAAEAKKVGMWLSTPTPKATAVIFVPSFTPLSTQSGILPLVPVNPQPTSAPVGNCSPSYPTVCIPPPPPDLDCGDISFRRFQVLPPDPHNFDRDGDGIGCESG